MKFLRIGRYTDFLGGLKIIWWWSNSTQMKDMNLYFSDLFGMWSYDFNFLNYKGNNGHVSSQEMSKSEIFQRSQKLDVSSEFLGGLKIIWWCPNTAQMKALNLYFSDLFGIWIYDFNFLIYSGNKKHGRYYPMKLKFLCTISLDLGVQ